MIAKKSELHYYLFRQLGKFGALIGFIALVIYLYYSFPIPFE